MKWKKVSEHPLPDGDGEKLYFIRRTQGNIDGLYIKPRMIPFKKDIIEWCEFNPDEIEIADSVIRQNQTTEKSSVVEHSWEEKFRWETAAKAMNALIIHQRQYEALGSSPPMKGVVAKMSLDYTDKLIKELKRGRE